MNEEDAILPGVLLYFYCGYEGLRKTQFCQSLVISCSRMRGEYAGFRDTLIVRRAGSHDC
uniref:Uncharacterized protein n=1 Tax=Rossellomorea aquimaris TaxID=189382 RepID=A0A366EJ81_9BACI|nr:hypothetical protein DET59_11575 [Rossellomorea aquimaris]